MIEYIVEVSLEDFPAWSGARDTLKNLIDHDKVGETETLLSDLFSDSTPTITDINDFLWFEDTWIYKTLGIDPYNEECEV